MLNIEKEREAFEAYISTKLPCSKPLVSFTYIDQENKYRRHEAWLDDPCWVKFINDSWEAWQASALRAEEKLEGCVVVPVEMPDSFDDALYMYSNDISVVNSESDGFIPMADLDHGKVWQLVVEAARGGNE
ncbi:hypothetical protein [Acinetobacter sp. ESBL14]|uniref:hypothetical protein n=1 Tax=Acinetobacter sp. ESBL14 TaxID=3077329 RepID=UPI002FC9C9FF